MDCNQTVDDVVLRSFSVTVTGMFLTAVCMFCCLWCFLQ